MAEWWALDELSDGGVPFARDSDGNLKEVGDVDRGKACGCFCVACGGALVAKKGEVRVHHFAHDDRRECRRALDASLFAMAMTVLREPGAKLGISELVLNGEALIPPGQVETDEAEFVLSESSRSGSVAPDILIRQHNIAVHFLAAQKPHKIAEAADRLAGFAVFAVNLRAYVRHWWRPCDPNIAKTASEIVSTRSEFRRRLLESSEGRGWLFHPRLEAQRAELAEHVRQRALQEQARLRQTNPAPGRAAELRISREKDTKAVYAERPTETVRLNAGICPVCQAPRNEVILGSGLFAGRRAFQCAKDSKHALQFVQ